MTSAVCPTCGSPTSTDTAVCAKCGAPTGLLESPDDPPTPATPPLPPAVADAEPEVDTRKTKRLVAVFGVVALLVVLIYFFGIRTSSVKADVMKAEIFYYKSQVIIVNAEPADLRNCTVAIISEDTYSLRGVEIPKGGNQIIDAVLFLNATSLRFNPKEQLPRHIDVSCDTANGKRIGGKDFRN
jgi:hypothetical protein